jgi:hypothetical protein
MAEIVQYQLAVDANYYRQGDVIFPPKFVNAYVMAAGVAQGVTIPTGVRVAIFSSTMNFYVNWLAAATVPVANVNDGSGPELNPTARDVTGYASFSMIAPADCVVTVAYFI